MADMSILSTTMDNFVSALKGMPAAIKPAAIGLLGTLTIIDLLWTYYKEVLEIDWIKYLVRKALMVGLIMYIINDYETIVNSVLKGFTKLGSLAVPSSGASSYIDNPSLLMAKITNIGVSMWNASSGLKEGFLAVALLAPLIIVGAVLCFQIIVSYIEFYFMTGFALIFVPLGAIGVGQQYFSNVFKALIGCAIKIATIQIILGLAESALAGATTVSKFDFQASIVLILTYAIITYIVLKIPAMASSLLTGSPSLNGNDVAKMIGSAAKTATMVGVAAVAGAVTGGIDGAKNGAATASSGIGKAFSGTLGAVGGAAIGAAGGAGNEMKHNIFGGSSNGTMERGSSGGGAFGSLFSKAGSESKDKSSNNGNSNVSKSSNNLTGNNNSSINSDLKNNSSGTTNSTQSDSNNASMSTVSSAMAALGNDKLNIFNGKNGSQGIGGINGDSGRDGVSGEDGPTGEYGKNGDIGTTGYQGEKGESEENKSSIYNSQMSSANSSNLNATSNESRKNSSSDKVSEDEDK